MSIIYKIVARSKYMRYLDGVTTEYATKEEAKNVISKACDKHGILHIEENDNFKNLDGEIIYKLLT